MKSKKTTDWQLFGWHGLTFQVPVAWNLGKVSGDFKSGYVRLDDAEIVRVEVEWREGKGALPISVIVDRYISALQEKAKKNNAMLEVTRGADFLDGGIEGADFELFMWEADYRAYNIAWRCETCGRIVLLRVLSKLKEKMSDVAAAVMRSLQDHTSDDKDVWSIYDLRCRVPTEFNLEEYTLKSGHIGLTLERGREILQVHRASLANVLLKNKSLEGWFLEFFRKSLKNLDYVCEEKDIIGHQGIVLTGTPRSRWRQFLMPLPFVYRRPRQFLDGRAWYCPDSNKIYAVLYLYRKRGEGGDVAEVMSREVVCHETEGSYQPGGDAELKAGTQPGTEVGKGR